MYAIRSYYAQADMDMICLTDDIDYIVGQIEVSLQNQMSELEDVGLEQTKYYQT